MRSVPLCHTCDVDPFHAVAAQGPSAKEAKRDTTAFEAARAEWSKATLSAKGSVGATGDHRSEMWLG